MSRRRPTTAETGARDFTLFLILAGAGLFLIEQAAGLLLDHRLTPPVLVVSFAAAVLLSGVIGAASLAAFDRLWEERAPARAAVLLPATYAVVLSLALIVIVLLGDLQPPSKPAILGGALVSFLLIMAALAADDYHPWRRRLGFYLIIVSWVGWSFAGLDRRALPEPVRLWIMLAGVGLMPAVAWRLAPGPFKPRRGPALVLLALALVWGVDTAGESILAARIPAEPREPVNPAGPNLLILAWDNPLPLAAPERRAARIVRLRDSSLTQQIQELAHSLGEQGYQAEAVWAGAPPARALGAFTYFNRRSNPRALVLPTGFALHDQLLASLRQELPPAWFEPALEPRQVSRRVARRLDSLDPERPWLFLARFAAPAASPDRPAFSWERPEVKDLLRSLESRGLLDHTVIVVIGARSGRTGEVWDPQDLAKAPASVSVLVRKNKPPAASPAAPPDADFAQVVLTAVRPPGPSPHPGRFDCPAPPCDNSP